MLPRTRDDRLKMMRLQLKTASQKSKTSDRLSLRENNEKFEIRRISFFVVFVTASHIFVIIKQTHRSKSIIENNSTIVECCYYSAAER